MGPQARQEYLAQLRDRYVRAGRKEKGRMLTEGGASERLCPGVSANAHNHSPFGNTCYGATKRRSVTLTYGSTRSFADQGGWPECHQNNDGVLMPQLLTAKFRLWRCPSSC